MPTNLFPLGYAASKVAAAIVDVVVLGFLVSNLLAVGRREGEEVRGVPDFVGCGGDLNHRPLGYEFAGRW